MARLAKRPRDVDDDTTEGQHQTNGTDNEFPSAISDVPNMTRVLRPRKPKVIPAQQNADRRATRESSTLSSKQTEESRPKKKPRLQQDHSDLGSSEQTHDDDAILAIVDSSSSPGIPTRNGIDATEDSTQVDIEEPAEKRPRRKRKRQSQPKKRKTAKKVAPPCRIHRSRVNPSLQNC